MKKQITWTLITLCALMAGTLPSFAGGALEGLDISGRNSTPIPGTVEARLVGIRWDPRTLPVLYRVNSTLDPIPNPLGSAFLSVATARTELQVSLDAWNSIPTSYIDMHIVGLTSNPGLRGFDFVNEVTFRTATGFGAIASSPSVSLIEHVTLENGEDIDGDSDSDVSSAITSAADVDGDGDIEFPAGFYRAGTILDNDVQFNTKTSNGFRFTVAGPDIVTRSVDLRAVAIHEFGHSFGLSHTLNNQVSPTDGTEATMFPFIDTGDPTAELALRTLDTDDIVWASYFYQEGSDSLGPAAIQPGDVPFNQQFGVIEGVLHHGEFDEPISGGCVFAVSKESKTLVSSTFSGTNHLSFNPATNELFLIDREWNVLNGEYVLPVPPGTYEVWVEPVDGAPVPAGSISLTAQIGSIFGQQNFHEQPSKERPEVEVTKGGERQAVKIVTRKTFDIANFGNRNFVGFTGSPAGRYYAVRIPADQITAINPLGRIAVFSAEFDTFVVDSSVVPVFAEATLTTGVVNASGSTATVNLTSPLSRQLMFVGQDNDLAPLLFSNGKALGQTIREDTNSGAVQNLFLVLRLPTTTPFPGVSGQPPLIGLDGGVATNDVPIFGLSYLSDDGGVTFNRVTNFNFRFALVLTGRNSD